MKFKDHLVFNVSIIIILLIVLVGALAPDTLKEGTASVQSFITDSFGWYYLIVVTFFVIICLYLLISPVGKIKLGKPDDKPEFSRLAWLAMLFSAGMGIGLVFYGTAEPLSHFAISSPTNEIGTNQGMKDAMRYTYFHWGIHAWAVYGIVALSLAYTTFRKGGTTLISSTLKPLLGHSMDGRAGRIIDIIAVFATVTGIATTLGFGAVQINGGLSFLYDIPSNFLTQFIIIVIVTVLFLLSALTGLGKGIKILSNTNMILAFVLFLIVFIMGNTVFILNLFTDTIGSYLQNLVRMSFRIAPLNGKNRQWIDAWTIFYWAWWIAWSPFVGIFIARISKGRTIREFITFVLFIPSVIGFLWFSVFGGNAMYLEHKGLGTISTFATEETLFALLEHYPLSALLSLLAILLVAVFFITSADSGTFVLGMLSANGVQNPSNRIKVIWGVLLTTISLVLLYSGGLDGLQNMMIIAALPFSLIMILMTVSLLKEVHQEKAEYESKWKKKKISK
ncbi:MULTISPECIES: glycine betaine uptake BCCT transporter [Bacillaceae]|uniref:glycine betaine uptake BCCT transporter n=1 Tax=Bacillaceae TaxID=186817 RepID=UPI001F48AA9D|nr:MULTISPECIES: BCCT family transporter [Bacillaceae]MCF2650378.1 BCCT family transporter [Niallia circulans]CAI9386920.1 Glycine betaine transporter OpuD [Bacillus sp. T2.9-1]